MENQKLKELSPTLEEIQEHKEEVKKKIDSLIKKEKWSKRAVGVCANHPECHEHRSHGSKYCEDCSVDYHNEHKDD